MKKNIAITAIVAISVICTSCKKDTATATSCEATVGNISGAYKIIGIFYTESLNVYRKDYSDIFFENKECQRDDLHTFSANGIYTVADTGVKCTPSSDELKPWRVSGNKFLVEGDKEATLDGYYCEPGIMYLKYFDWDKSGDELLVVYKKQ